MEQIISDRDMAELFLRNNSTIGLHDSAESLVDQVKAWLSRHGMTHRDVYDIAQQVIRLIAEKAHLAPAPSPEDAAWQQNQAEGIGDPQQLTPEQIRDMPMAAFAKLRNQLGLGQSKGIGILGRIT